MLKSTITHSILIHFILSGIMLGFNAPAAVYCLLKSVQICIIFDEKRGVVDFLYRM